MGKQIYLSKLTKRFEVGLEESWQGESSKNPERRWLEIIECFGFKKGPPQSGAFICLYSEDPLSLQKSNEPLSSSEERLAGRP